MEYLRTQVNALFEGGHHDAVKHLMVQAGWDSGSSGGKGSKHGKGRWEPVQEACRFEGDMEPACIEAFFEHLGKNNDLEWWIWLSDFFAA